MVKKLLRNERGLTLIELLAVVVILGIISAIAIPSIGGIIDNSKKDADVANAKQMINSAKIAISADPTLLPTADKGTKVIALSDLVSGGYLDSPKDPDGGTYDATNSKVTITAAIGSNNAISYSYHVLLTNGTRGIDQDEANLTRASVLTTVTGK